MDAQMQPFTDEDYEALKRLVAEQIKTIEKLTSELKAVKESRDKLETGFEYADREARLAIERIKELETHTNSCPYVPGYDEETGYCNCGCCDHGL